MPFEILAFHRTPLLTGLFLLPTNLTHTQEVFMNQFRTPCLVWIRENGELGCTVSVSRQSSFSLVHEHIHTHSHKYRLVPVLGRACSTDNEISQSSGTMRLMTMTRTINVYGVISGHSHGSPVILPLGHVCEIQKRQMERSFDTRKLWWGSWS